MLFSYVAQHSAQFSIRQYTAVHNVIISLRPGEPVSEVCMECVVCCRWCAYLGLRS